MWWGEGADAVRAANGGDQGRLGDDDWARKGPLLVVVVGPLLHLMAIAPRAPPCPCACICVSAECWCVYTNAGERPSCSFQ